MVTVLNHPFLLEEQFLIGGHTCCITTKASGRALKTLSGDIYIFWLKWVL